MESVKVKQKKAFEILKDKSGYKNPMQTPRISKVVVSTGVGSLKDKKKIDLVIDRLSKITGQKPSIRGAKQSVAAFKIRQGDPVGLQVTLRGKRMYDFIDKLLNIALPRTKDFRGVPLNSIDEMGNYTLGIREHTIFPETSDEDLRDVFGISVTFVTTSKNKKETENYLRFLNFPFRKTEEVKEKKQKRTRRKVAEEK